MIDKIVQTMAEAMAGIRDGSTVLIGGFGAVGQPDALIEALIEHGAKDLVCVANNAGSGRVGLARLMELLFDENERGVAQTAEQRHAEESAAPAPPPLEVELEGAAIGQGEPEAAVQPVPREQLSVEQLLKRFGKK